MLAAVASGAFGRSLKQWPGLPKGLLPWLVLACGYAITFAMQRIADVPLYDAAAYAFNGLGAGLVAVGGHEALRPLLSRFLGAAMATKLLGRLPSPEIVVDVDG